MTDLVAFDRSINDKLKNVSRLQAISLAETRRQFVFERFLSRLFAESNSSWVLKGGTGLLIRLPNARFSRDVDLYNMTNSIEAAVADIRAIISQPAEDFFRFDITKVVSMAGPVDGATLSVTARLGAKTFDSFSIDLSTKLTLVQPELVTPKPMISDRRLIVHPIRLYPIADHIADKLCAMYSVYGASGSVSTRYRDLVDLVLIIQQYSVDSEVTAAAIAAEARRRDIRLPTTMVSPGPLWTAGYRAEARRFGRFDQELQTLEGALTFVAGVIDPLLPNDRAGQE